MWLEKPSQFQLIKCGYARGNEAIVDHTDATISSALSHWVRDRRAIDADIVNLYNVIGSQQELLAQWDKAVIEEPPGEKQIIYHIDSDQWVRRGDVLRCIIGDGGPEGEVIIDIDGKELLLETSGG